MICRESTDNISTYNKALLRLFSIFNYKQKKYYHEKCIWALINSLNFGNQKLILSWTLEEICNELSLYCSSGLMFFISLVIKGTRRYWLYRNEPHSQAICAKYSIKFLCIYIYIYIHEVEGNTVRKILK